MQGQGIGVPCRIHCVARVAVVRAVIGLAVVTGTAINSAFGVDVKLRERVVPKGAVVRLGDVADVISADRPAARKLAAVPLMPAPAPETELYLRQREVADMLAASGVDLATVDFAGAERVIVAASDRVQQVSFEEDAQDTKTSAATEDRQAILDGMSAAKSAASLDLAQATALNDAVCRIIGEYVRTKTGEPALRRIECSVADRQLAQLAASTNPPVCSGGAEPFAGRQKFELTIAAERGPSVMVVYADISAPAMPTVIAVRPVARGNVITAADVEVRTMERTAKTAGQRAVVDSMESIVGKEARQPLQVGEMVFTDQVQLPVMVKRGDRITVASKGGGISVRTSARALQEGATGDLIQVESPESKQRYDARVTGLREAAVFAPARVITPEKVEKKDLTARRPRSSSK
jgi:flagella basal body P-ring formation protein FlgA